MTATKENPKCCENCSCEPKNENASCCANCTCSCGENCCNGDNASCNCGC